MFDIKTAYHFPISSLMPKIFCIQDSCFCCSPFCCHLLSLHLFEICCKMSFFKTSFFFFSLVFLFLFQSKLSWSRLSNFCHHFFTYKHPLSSSYTTCCATINFCFKFSFNESSLIEKPDSTSPFPCVKINTFLVTNQWSWSPFPFESMVFLCNHTFKGKSLLIYSLRLHIKFLCFFKKIFIVKSACILL